MKFSNSLKFNAVAEWWDEYIAYAALKKTIYELEGLGNRNDGASYGETHSLLASGDQSGSTNEKFIPLLDRELAKIVNFYKAQEPELRAEIDDVAANIARREEEGLGPDPRYVDDDESDDDDVSNLGSSSSPHATRRRRRTLSGVSPNYSSLEHQHNAPGDLEASYVTYWPEESPERRVSRNGRSNSLSNALKSPRAALANLFNPQPPESVWTSKSTFAWETRMLFKRRITALYITATSLKSYVDLNHSGFRKILKKYDKITENDLKDRYMHENVEVAYPFEQASRSRLNDMIAEIVAQYATCITQGDGSQAQKQLRLYQREQIVWERDTVWRQMIGEERRGERDGQVKNLVPSSALGGTTLPLATIPTPFGGIKVTGNRISILVALTSFLTLLNVKTVEGPEANRCFAIFVFATILWATEAIPLFVTSTSVPFLVAVLRVIRTPEGEPMSAPDATKFVFSIMFSPTIMLLLGGFTLSSALSKTNIDRIIITRVLSFAGTRPSTVLLAFMCVSCFASMWISNVAAPALCFALIRPILSSLPPKSTFAPCLIMAIALAANIGGQSSPISSPQNLIALDAMNPRLDWLHWFAVAIPVSVVSVLLIWLLLLVIYRPSNTADGQRLSIKPIRATRETFTLKQYWVMFVCVVTIGLWCVAHEIETYFGDMGIIAIIPIVAFFGSGVLKKADFDQFLWSIVFLAMGGISLGKAVVSSGLIGTMDVAIRDRISGLRLYEVVLALTAVVVVVSTFISHTIASVLLVPIAADIGASLSTPHPRLLIFITGLVCSTGMGMPVSGFPNQTAATQEDDMGILYLTNIDFLKCGVPASMISALVVASIGYILMLLVKV